LAEAFDQLAVGLGEGLGMEAPLDGVHRMLHRHAVDADPLDLAIDTPLGEVRRRPAVLDHVAELVRIRAVPAIAMPAGLEQQDVTLAHLDLRLDHLRRINAAVADVIRNVDDHAWPVPMLERHLADSATPRPE